jgi:hypothetical protein
MKNVSWCRTIAAAVVLAGMVTCLAPRASAQSRILETATYTLTSGDPIPFGGAAFGVRFHVDTTTIVTSVRIGNLSGTGQFYAAIVAVGASGFPIGHPFNDDEAMGHATFTAAGGDQRIALAATLPPGEYMFIAGSGKYSTTGNGGLATEGQTLLGTPAVYFHAGNWMPMFGLYNVGLDPMRFVVEGLSEHQTILDTVLTRASQSSVDAMATAVAGKASQSSVDALASGVGAIGGSIGALSAQVGTRASQTSVDGLSASIASQFSNLFTDLGTRASQATLATVAGDVATRASQSSVNGLAASLTSLGSTAATQTQVAGVSTAVAGVAASIATLPTQADLAGVSAAVSGAIGSRASQASVDALGTQLTSDTSLRLAIEDALSSGRRIATFFLPSSVGGHLETVRDVVADALIAAQQAGLDTTKARSQFDKGDVALTAGAFKTAYDWYATAYQVLIR